MRALQRQSASHRVYAKTNRLGRLDCAGINWNLADGEIKLAAIARHRQAEIAVNWERRRGGLDVSYGIHITKWRREKLSLVLLSLFLLCSTPGAPQKAKPAKKPANPLAKAAQPASTTDAAPAAPPDPLGRSTPHGCVVGFLVAAQGSRGNSRAGWWTRACFLCPYGAGRSC